MKYIISLAITLFFIMDPIGNIPLFISELNVVKPERRKIVLFRELLIALAVFIVFFFAGNWFLDVLHLSTESIQIGGGIVLFIIALRMIFPHHKFTEHTDSGDLGDEPFVVPLAIPLVAGPSALAVILILKNNSSMVLIENLIALLIAWLASSIILFFSTAFFKILKKRGLIALERLMGMILVIMSIQMLLDGIYSYFVTFHGK